MRKRGTSTAIVVGYREALLDPEIADEPARTDRTDRDADTGDPPAEHPLASGGMLAAVTSAPDEHATQSLLDSALSPLSVDASREEMPSGGAIDPAAVGGSASAPPASAERRPSFIGGDESDIVPVIPNTVVEFQDASTDFDDEDASSATVDALMAACSVMVDRVNTIRKAQDGTQIVSGLITLISDLDSRYASDWGVVHRNGLEHVLIEVRQSIPEADSFILESLENGRGGLSANTFLQDLRTIAPADRSRMITHYAIFLVHLVKCVLRQYLSALQGNPTRQRDVSRRLDYLVDGVRDALLMRINGIS